MTKTLIARKGPMHSPSHPGEILQTMYLEPLGFSITRAARELRCSRKHLSSVVNGNSRITVALARRIAREFGNEPHFWLALQAQYDLARHK